MTRDKLIELAVQQGWITDMGRCCICQDDEQELQDHENSPPCVIHVKPECARRHGLSW